MLGMIKKATGIVFGNRTFATPTLPYVGADSVLRLGPTDYRQWLNDVAGGGHVAGFAVWQGAPSTIAVMLPTNSVNGGGTLSGYGQQPGPLYAAPETTPVVSN